MTPKVKEILEKFKGKKAIVFIDDANIFHAKKEAGINIDWLKLKKLLENYFQTSFIKYYRGYYSEHEQIDQTVRAKHDNYGKLLKNFGFDLITRPLKKIYIDKGKVKYIYKCDFDGEIGYDIASNLQTTELIILVSGDSDFAFLEKKLLMRHKTLLVICFQDKAPWEFRRLTHIFFEEIRNEVEIKTPRLSAG